MLRRLKDWWRGPLAEVATAPTPQAGAVPYRLTRDGPVFLLVTSRRTGRWLFPKGGLMSGRTPWESAAQEALEEAGVEGVVSDQPLGTYLAKRIRGERIETIAVTLYLLEVTRQLDRWDEKAQRQRRWADLDTALDLLGDAALGELLRSAAAELAARPAPEPEAAPKPSPKSSPKSSQTAPSSAPGKGKKVRKAEAKGRRLKTGSKG
ncbi:NUDIX hydrolase [Phenylobacterium sp.]|uniref:NUDIX hydrolase n=1 Tax=Phenylobacterium sp. TaxID=1871053 RepID=UPI002730C40C|nr:NUDIX hydrolase [Phenylobacterium sp.]MDP1617744.1 NUDIX hydrolase [Phenylobacterium sp.]MDP1986139.1 NUDIX hydrolase [Phenylobacterium sp.]